MHFELLCHFCQSSWIPQMKDQFLDTLNKRSVERFLPESLPNLLNTKWRSLKYSKSFFGAISCRFSLLWMFSQKNNIFCSASVEMWTQTKEVPIRDTSLITLIMEFSKEIYTAQKSAATGQLHQLVLHFLRYNAAMLVLFGGPRNIWWMREKSEFLYDGFCCVPFLLIFRAYALPWNRKNCRNPGPSFALRSEAAQSRSLSLSHMH